MSANAYDLERQRAASAFHESIARTSQQQNRPHMWIVLGTINEDRSLTLDEAPGQRIYHYTLPDVGTLPLSASALDATTVQAWISQLQNQQKEGAASLATYPAPATAGGPELHSHVFALPPQFAPPQPGDRVLVAVQTTRSGTRYDDGPDKECHVMWRLRSVDIEPGG